MEIHPLRQFRQDQQLTQKQLAEMLGVKKPTVSRWETGTRKVDESKLAAVSELTGIPTRELRPDLAEAMGEAVE